MKEYSLISALFLNPILEGYGNRVVVVDGSQTYTYQQIFDKIQQVAAHESFDKFIVGDIIACALPNPMEALIVFFALIYRGLIPCMLNPDHIQNANGFPLITTIDSYINDAIIKQQSPVEYDIAFCLYTSGTTGHPSLVFHRHRDPILMNENYSKKVLKLCDQDIILASSRYYFAYGLNSVFFALLNKAKLIIPAPELTPQSVWQFINQFKPTVLFSVPTFYKRLLMDVPEHLNIDSLRVCVSAGENLPLPIFTQWKERTGQSIIDGIGTTEILSTFISNRSDKLKPGSTGCPVPGFTTELRHIETNQTVQAGEIGVLWVKGDTYVPYYPNNRAETFNRFVDGWFKTNDLFSIDSDGFYFYHGRVNELIKVSGIWVYPYKIEAALLKHPAISEAIVSGVKEEDGLTRLYGTIVLNDGYSENSDLTAEIKAWAKQSCAKHEYPHFIHYVKSLPKTASGKTKRYLLKTQQELNHV